MTGEIVDFETASKHQQIIKDLGTQNICTKFCSVEFLQYHEDNKTKEFITTYISGEIDKQRYVFPLSHIRPSTFKAFSHIGSPYAGLCINSNHPDTIRRAYQECIQTIKHEFENITELEIRLPPTILSTSIAAHQWALWSLGFTPTAVYFGRYFDASADHALNRNRRRRVSRIDSKNMMIRTSTTPSADAFDVIRSNREIRHSVRPTHNLKDFNTIETLLPGTVKTYYVTHDDKICSVAIVFEDIFFSTIQYLGGLECSFECGSQDILVLRVMETYRKNSKKLLFGTSTEPSEGHRILNKGLDLYKDSFGSIGYTAERLSYSFS